MCNALQSSSFRWRWKKCPKSAILLGTELQSHAKCSLVSFLARSELGSLLTLGFFLRQETCSPSRKYCGVAVLATATTAIATAPLCAKRLVEHGCDAAKPLELHFENRAVHNDWLPHIIFGPRRSTKAAILCKSSAGMDEAVV